jgi:hypothetical protein
MSTEHKPPFGSEMLMGVVGERHASVSKCID